MEQLTPKRVLIFCADIQVISGFKPHSSRELIAKIRQQLNMQPWRPLNVYHVSEYMDIPVTELVKILSL